eukprot:g44663.t1
MGRAQEYEGCNHFTGLYYRPPNRQRVIEQQICGQITEHRKNNRVVEVGDFNFPYTDTDSLSARSLGHGNFKKEEELGVLESIKVDKFPRPDWIYPRMLREVDEEIAGALYKIFVFSLDTGEFPDDWKIVNVVPL